MTDFKLPDIGTGESTKLDEFREIDVLDEFGKIHEHFFDDDGKVNSDGGSVIFFPIEHEWFSDTDEKKLSLFTDKTAWANLGDSFDDDLFYFAEKSLETSTDQAPVTNSPDDLSALDFGNEELSNLIKKASTLFSRSDIEKVVGILDMKSIDDIKVKEYSI